MFLGQLSVGRGPGSAAARATSGTAVSSWDKVGRPADSFPGAVQAYTLQSRNSQLRPLVGVIKIIINPENGVEESRGDRRML